MAWAGGGLRGVSSFEIPKDIAFVTEVNEQGQASCLAHRDLLGDGSMDGLPYINALV